jgi:hypothetical protein
MVRLLTSHICAHWTCDGVKAMATSGNLRFACSHRSAEQVTSADGGIAGLPMVCCVLAVMDFRAAAEFERSEWTRIQDT